MGFNRLLANSLFLLLLLPGGVFAAGLEAERDNAAALFDGNLPSAPSAGLSPASSKDASADFLRQMKEVLSSGVWNGSTPQMRQFVFRNSQEGWTAQAQSVGLEGFLWTKKELEGKYGEAAFSGQLNDYFSYLDELLKPVAWTSDLRKALADLKGASLTGPEKNARLNAILENYVDGLHANMERYDAAAWAKKARIYELFPRAYNAAGRRGPGGSFFRDSPAS